jgi:adenosylmethionine-8-amino-7-oxononanoate aminotransferase
LFRPPIEGDEEFIVQFCLDVLLEVIHEEHPYSIAAVLLEPIQGVNGIVVLPAEYIVKLREMTREYGILLIMDEVATGVGRTGQWLASHHYGVEADLLTLSKGLTGGFFPMGATLISKEIQEKLFGSGGIFLHGSTQSGHPVGCAAALATMDVIDEDHLVQNADTKGTYILHTLKEGLSNHPKVGDVRGLGLMMAIEFVEDRKNKVPVTAEWGKRFAHHLREEGILGNFFNGVLLMYPPLSITQSEAEYLVEGVLRAVKKAG